MIRTLDDRFLKHVKELKVGDIFQTDCNGALPWSQWFFVVGKPRLRTCLHPKKHWRWEVHSFPIIVFFGAYLFKLILTKNKKKIKQLARILHRGDGTSW